MNRTIASIACLILLVASAIYVSRASSNTERITQLERSNRMASRDTLVKEVRSAVDSLAYRAYLQSFVSFVSHDLHLTAKEERLVASVGPWNYAFGESWEFHVAVTEGVGKMLQERMGAIDPRQTSYEFRLYQQILASNRLMQIVREMDQLDASSLPKVPTSDELSAYRTKFEALKQEFDSNLFAVKFS